MRKRRVWWRALLVAALLLTLVGVSARAALPSYLRDHVNRTIDRSPEYDGRVGGIDVYLWRGAYTIHDIDIVKTAGGRMVPVPFFESPRVEFSLDWRALWKGAARGKLVMEKPKLNFVHGPTTEETQTGADQPWLGIIHDLYPFRIDRAEIHQGEIHFHAFHTDPPVDVFLSDVRATVKNLTNIDDQLDPLIAEVRAGGDAMESGRFEFEMNFDPQAHRPSFDLATRLLDLDVTQLNRLAQAYGDFDFEAGRFDFVLEVTATEGYLQGYAKPLFRNVRVFALRDVKDDPLQAFWEALVGVMGFAFQNQPRDQFATRITLEGDVANPQMDLLEMVGNVLRNAFIRAYLPRIEGHVTPELAVTETNGSNRTGD